MLRGRFAGGLLAAGLVAAAAACAPATERATGTVPVAAEVPVTAATSRPPTETLTILYEQALPNVKGKTFTSAIADFPPGARAVPHRHGDAFLYVYVLEGTLRSRLSGQPVRTYRRGESFVEPPGSHHVLSENTSQTERAKLLVIFISDTGDKIKIDDPTG
ncbi:cupin domain-containing protein [Nonomuraea sp. NPDC005650]|uniref:cupin domain-containing protein n=1 Tax=Nonomuraea sp. NPDC005650 TaxID=3157045 RepID=UPI0033BBAC24